MTRNKRFWPKNWPMPPEPLPPPPIAADKGTEIFEVTKKWLPKWEYDKNNMMWRRDVNVRVIATTRGWIAVHSMKGRLEPDFNRPEDGKAAADAEWPA